MAVIDYTLIRTGIRDYIATNVSWLTADLNCLDYSPTEAEVLFGNLPMVTVDFDYTSDINWRNITQGYERRVPFRVELYTEITKPDLSHGRNASQDLSARLNELENLFVASPSIGGLVKGSNITSSKMELVQLRAVKLGVLARWAWLSLTTRVVK